MGAFKEFFQKGNKIQITDKLTIGARIVTFFSELIATGILMFMGCMGGVQKMTGNKVIPVEHQSWAFGIAVLASIQIFGHISGAHLNPVVSLAAYILGNLSLIQFFLYFVAQLLGAIGGFGILVLVSPPYAMDNNDTIRLSNDETYKKPGVCSPAIHVDITIWQGFLTEFMASLILTLVCCGLWDRRNSTKLDSIPIKFGMVIAGLSMTVGHYTTNQINPVRSFAPAFFNGDWRHHWLFWVAPMLAGLVGAFFYKILFEQPREMNTEDLEK